MYQTIQKKASIIGIGGDGDVGLSGEGKVEVVLGDLGLDRLAKKYNDKLILLYTSIFSEEYSQDT